MKKNKNKKHENRMTEDNGNTVKQSNSNVACNTIYQNQTYSLVIYEPPYQYQNRWCYDTKVKSIALTWDKILELFPDDVPCRTAKTDSSLFSASGFKTVDDPSCITTEDFRTHALFPKKDKRNVLSVSMLLLDYDAEFDSLDYIAERFNQYRYLCYTSFSDTLKEGKPGRRCCRVVLPLAEPIPAHLLDDSNGEEVLTSLLNDRFSDADPASFNLAQAFFVPACQTANQHHSKIWNHEGSLFDWRTELTIRTVPKKTLPRKTVLRKPLPRDSKAGTLDYKTLDLVTFCSDKGLLVRQLEPGKYEIECPRAFQHSDDNDAAVIWDSGTNGWEWGFNCFHAHVGDHKNFIHWAKEDYGDDAFRGYCDVSANYHSAEELMLDNARRAL